MRRLYHKAGNFASGGLCCPRCGAEAAIYYRDELSKEIIGCSECLQKIDCYDLQTEQEETQVWAEIDRQIDDILERRAMV